MSHQKPLPVTKDGYRYNWGEDDEPLCSRYIKELNSVADANKRVNQPTFVKRKVISTIVKLSENDRAPQLKLNEECTRVTGEKGYSMVRASHGANRGKFYYEVHIDSMPENTATRIGWSQYYSNLQAPLGYDYYGYSWRSRFGTKFHQARGKTFDKGGGYGEGDVIGCMIELPYGNPQNITRAEHLPTSIKANGYIVVAKKKDTARIIEEQDKPPALSSMKPLVGSKISFYKNGRFVGVAFEDVFSGFYYPSISLYKSCTVSVNFGPKFEFPPEKYNESSKNHLCYRPAQDMAEISIIDNFLSDLIYILDLELGVDGKNGCEEIIRKSIQN